MTASAGTVTRTVSATARPTVAARARPAHPQHHTLDAMRLGSAKPNDATNEQSASGNLVNRHAPCVGRTKLRTGKP
jgi:hypothetical protein